MLQVTNSAPGLLHLVPPHLTEVVHFLTRGTGPTGINSVSGDTMWALDTTPQKGIHFAKALANSFPLHPTCALIQPTLNSNGA